MEKDSETFADLSLQDNDLIPSLRFGKNANRGMTLLELLIVIALISIVALASTSLIIDTGEWKRQQVTEDQWLAVKRSIVGDNVVDANGRREYAGFASDMGRLPNCLRELVRPLDCTADINAASRLTNFTQDIDSNQWYGWRGPYLGIGGSSEYRDGWDNHGRDDDTGNDDDVNYGWLFGNGEVNGTPCEEAVVDQPHPGAIILQSCGDDGEVDNTEAGFPGDYPYVAFEGGNATYIPLVTRHDYQVDLGAAWRDVPINFIPTKVGQSRIISADDLRLRINYPIDGSMPDWTDALIDDAGERDDAPFLSALFPANARRLIDATGKVYTGADGDSDGLTDIAATTQNVTVPLGTAVSGTLMTLPASVSSTLTFADSSILTLQDCPCETVIDAGTLTTTTNLNGATTIQIKPENVAPIMAELGHYMIEVPQGTAQNVTPNPTILTLPNGATLTLNTGAEDAYFPKIILRETAGTPTVTVSETFEFNHGDLVETDTSRDQFLVPSTSTPVGNEITIAKSAPTIPKGLRNITIVCETDGFLFDGNCADNTVAPAVYNPIATPYALEVSPRSYVPLPDAIGWDIQ